MCLFKLFNNFFIEKKILIHLPTTFNQQDLVSVHSDLLYIQSYMVIHNHILQLLLRGVNFTNVQTENPSPNGKPTKQQLLLLTALHSSKLRGPALPTQPPGTQPSTPVVQCHPSSHLRKDTCLCKPVRQEVKSNPIIMKYKNQFNSEEGLLQRMFVLEGELRGKVSSTSS